MCAPSRHKLGASREARNREMSALGDVYTPTITPRTKSGPSMRRARNVRRDIAAAALAGGLGVGCDRPGARARTAGRRHHARSRGVRTGVQSLNGDNPFRTGQSR